MIGLFPEWFFPPQPDWPDQLRLTHFPLWDRSELNELNPEVNAFLDDGSPPIAFTPGTGNRQARRFFSAAVEACQCLGRRALLLTNYPEQLPTNLPKGIRHFEYVPFLHMKSRLAAVVHHAGTGTAAQCMRAAIPQVVVPMAYDQPDFADCLVRLGVARQLKPRAIRGRTLKAALEHVLSVPQILSRCREGAMGFQDAKPFDRTCDSLEELGREFGVKT